MSVECDQLRERVRALEVLVDANDRRTAAVLAERNRALELQHTGYEKHLADLNHENARVKEISETNVTVPAFDAEHDRVIAAAKSERAAIDQASSTLKDELVRRLDGIDQAVGTLQVQVAGGTGQIESADKAWGRSTQRWALVLSGLFVAVALLGILVTVLTR